MLGLMTAVTAGLTLTEAGQADSCLGPAPAQPGPAGVAGAGPGWCPSCQGAGLRILTSTPAPSLGQAVVTSSHGVRTEKRISEQVSIH